MPLNSENLNSALNLDLATTNRVLADAIGGSNPIDTYRISVSQASDLKISLQGLKANADLQVIRDANGNGKIDDREVLMSLALKGIGLDAINLSLAAGSYFVQVYAGDTGIATTYSLNYAATGLGTPDSSDLTATRSYFGTGVLRSFYNSRGLSTYQKPAGQVVAFGNLQPAPSNFVMYGAIADYYTNNYTNNPNTTNGLSGVTSGLGNPTSSIYELSDGSSAMDFEGGQLVNRGGVVTPVYNRYGGDRFDLVGQGAPNGAELQWKDDYAWFGRDLMGQATGAVRRTGSGYVQEFVGGSGGDSILTLKDGQQVLGGTEKYTDDLGKLVDQAKGGPYKVQGEILRVYRSLGGFDRTVGGLGFATMSSERANVKGYKAYQEFENGSIAITKDGKIVVQDRQGKAFASNATDFNGDGRSDLFWRHAVTGHNVIWTMNGGTHVGVNLEVEQFADPNWKMVGSGDFDNDGRADLLWRNTATGENRIWRMNGGSHLAGDLTVEKMAAGPNDPNGLNWQVVGAADMDGDGKTDIVWRNGVTGENSIWKMNGNARVSTMNVEVFTDLNWRIVGVADFDGDRRTDLLWRNSVSGQNIVWRMDGSAHLGDLVVESVTDTAWQVGSTADMDGDGQADIVWRHGVAGTNVLWKMNGNSHVGNNIGIETVDMTWKLSGNGSDNPVAPRGMFRAEYFNNNALAGQAVFTRIAAGIDNDWGELGPGNSIGNDNFSVRWTGIFNFDQATYRFSPSMDDGMRIKIDGNLVYNAWTTRIGVDQLFTQSITAGLHRIEVEYREDGGLAIAKLNWRKAIQEVAKPGNWQATVYDWNGQGQPSTSLGDYATNPKAVAMLDLGVVTRSDGKQGFQANWGAGAVRDNLGMPVDNFAVRALTTATFDGGVYKFSVKGDDGFQLLAKRQGTADWISITPQNVWDQGYDKAREYFYALPAGTYEVCFQMYEQGGAAAIDLSWEKSKVASDFDNDGRSDLFWRNAVTGDNVIWKMNDGNHVGDLLVDRVADTNWKVVGVADFDGDGKTDLLWRNTATGDNLIWRMNGGSHIGDLAVEKQADLGWQIVGTADFDRDGKADIVWRNGVTGENSIWKMNGNAHVSTLKVGTVDDLNWRIVGLADFNGDKQTDLLWRNSASGDNLIWLMNGNNPVMSLAVERTDLDWQVGTVGDFDGDGRTDILWRNGGTGDDVIWKMDGNKHLSNVWTQSVDTSWKISTGGSDNPVAPVGAFRAEYFNNNALAGQAVFTKIDGGINNDWGLGGPGNGIGSDNFSIQWTGLFNFDQAKYRFSPSLDDGMLIRIDGVVVHNTWDGRNALDYLFTKDMTAGLHKIEVAYREYTGGAIAKFNWRKDIRETVKPGNWQGTVYDWNGQGQPGTDFWAGDYQNNPRAAAVLDLGSPTRSDGKQGFQANWGTGAVKNNLGLPTDNFAVRAYTVANFDGGTYKFNVKADDGFQLLAKRWGSNDWIYITPQSSWEQSYTNKQYFYTLAAGTYDLHFHMYEQGGAAAIDLSWERAQLFQEQTQWGQWTAVVSNWNGLGGNQASIEEVTKSVSSPQALGVVNLGSGIRGDGKAGLVANWGAGSVNGDNRLPTDMFAVRAFTQTQFDGGVYKFIVRADDGFQLMAKQHGTSNWTYITSQNSWEQSYGNYKEYTVQLNSGMYDMHFQMYEAGGDAAVDLSWRKRTSGPSNYNRENFSGTVMPSGGANTRFGVHTTDDIDRVRTGTLSFDGWTIGETISGDSLWFHIAGTEDWVASALINGNPPSLMPQPIPNQPQPIPNQPQPIPNQPQPPLGGTLIRDYSPKSIRIGFDYGSDINNFFDSSKRIVLERAARYWENLIVQGKNEVSTITIRVSASVDLSSTVGAKTTNVILGTNDLFPSAHIAFNRNLKFSTQNEVSPSEADFLTVAEHEIGHALGIGVFHPSTPISQDFVDLFNSGFEYNWLEKILFADDGQHLSHCKLTNDVMYYSQGFGSRETHIGGADLAYLAFLGYGLSNVGKERTKYEIDYLYRPL
jgi:hypothetical protein